MSVSSSRRCHVCNGTGTVGGHLRAVVSSVEHADGEVTLHREDVAFATDLGLRRAAQLMDEWAEDLPEVSLREWEPATAVNDYEGRKKAIVVDVSGWSV